MEYTSDERSGTDAGSNADASVTGSILPSSPVGIAVSAASPKGPVLPGAASLVERAARIRQRYNVGAHEIFPNAFLAPMSGVTDICFRRVISRIAAGRTGLLVSEFVSVEGMTRLNPKTCSQMRFAPEERPFSVQIFGAEPSRMGWGARMVEESGADFVEINCGCPAPKVVRKGGGSGLLRDTSNLRRILAEVKRSVSIPVTIKVRMGWDEPSINLRETLAIAEGEGASAFVIHGRTRVQGYKGLADWNRIAEAKSWATIPVIGNGDILRVEDILSRLETYGVDGVAIGRGAMHNPWMFAHIADLYQGVAPREPTLDDQAGVFHLYRQLLSEEIDPELHALRILGKLKQMAARFMKCLRGSAKARTALLRSQSMDEFFDNLHSFYDGLKATEAGWSPEAVRELNGKEVAEVQWGEDY